MKPEVKLLECIGKTGISKITEPAFYRAYQQSVLLALREQGLLSEPLCQCCLDVLDQQITREGQARG